MTSVPRVLVTGASGYIATHVVQQLQQTGQYLVRGTVRSLKNATKVDPLRKLCTNPKHEIELVEADLMKPDGWEDVVRGCTYVMHMASPFPTEDPKDEEEIIRPAVDGTLNVLKAVHKVGGVKRVVLTSSVAAISGGLEGGPRPYTESDWTDSSKAKSAYVKSKTLAEKAAWDYLKSVPDREKFELTVINPVLVMGPMLCGTAGTSISIIRNLIDHAIPEAPRANFPLVDVRDVALAHLRGMTNPAAAGQRHILFTKCLWMAEIGNILDKELKCSGYEVTTGKVPKKIDPSTDKITEFENNRMQDVLGITPTDMNKTIIDMAFSMIDAGQAIKTDKYKLAYPNGKKISWSPKK